MFNVRSSTIISTNNKVLLSTKFKWGSGTHIHVCVHGTASPSRREEGRESKECMS